jgi:hypothetical protein
MFGNYQRPDADKHYQCREDDAVLIGCQHRFTIGIFMGTSFCHKDGIIITLTKDEGGKDDIHYIEFYAKENHESQYPYPTDRHRQERNYGKFDTSEREPKEYEYYSGTCYSYIVKIIGETVGNGTIHTLHIKAAREEFLGIMHVILLYPHPVNDRISLLRCVDAYILHENGIRQRREIVKRPQLIVARYYLEEVIKGIVAESCNSSFPLQFIP